MRNNNSKSWENRENICNKYNRLKNDIPKIQHVKHIYDSMYKKASPFKNEQKTEILYKRYKWQVTL